MTRTIPGTDPATGKRIICDSPACPHTARWLTDSGMLYCDGHHHLVQAEDRIAQLAKAATA